MSVFDNLEYRASSWCREEADGKKQRRNILVKSRHLQGLSFDDSLELLLLVFSPFCPFHLISGVKREFLLPRHKEIPQNGKYKLIFVTGLSGPGSLQSTDMEETYLYHKLEAMRLVNEQIADPVQSTSDGCLSLIAALAMVEVRHVLLVRTKSLFGSLTMHWRTERNG